MRIGVDIDDTISKTNEALIKAALLYDKEHVRGRGFQNKNAYSFMEMFYWNVMDVDNFMSTVRKGKFFLTLDEMDKASFYINKLKKDGNEIIFITRRNNDFKTKMKTKKWLKEKGFKYDGLLLGCKEKGLICKDNGIDFFVDNDEKNVYDALDYGIKAVLMGSDYNQDEKELLRFSSWEEIYNYISGVK